MTPNTGVFSCFKDVEVMATQKIISFYVHVAAQVCPNYEGFHLRDTLENCIPPCKSVSEEFMGQESLEGRHHRNGKTLPISGVGQWPFSTAPRPTLSCSVSTRWVCLFGGNRENRVGQAFGFPLKHSELPTRVPPNSFSLTHFSKGCYSPRKARKNTVSHSCEGSKRSLRPSRATGTSAVAC